MLGNQILKVQQSLKSQSVTPGTNIISNSISNTGTSHMTSIASTNTGTMVVNSNQNINPNAPKTVVLGSTGQTIRVQSPQVQVQAQGSGQGQSMVLGTTVKVRY